LTHGSYLAKLNQEAIMDIRKIEYFLCVVEEESFTKAAKRIHVSQSGISQQIASLEEELSVILINRHKNRFELTEAGAYLYQACRDFVNQYHFIEKKTKEIHYRSQLDINVGYAGPIESTIIEPMVSLIQAHYPDLNFNFEKSSFQEIINALYSRSMDMVISYTYDLKKSSEVMTIPLRRKPLGLIVSTHHPLAQTDRIKASEVAGEKIIMLNPDYGQKSYENMIKCCRLDGYEPNIVQEVPTCESMFLKVNANSGVSFFSKGYVDKIFKNIHYLELEDTHHIDCIDLSWLKDNGNAYIPKITKLIQTNLHKLF
jgi:DNA-binding transcriptional LysR family regulator